MGEWEEGKDEVGGRFVVWPASYGRDEKGMRGCEWTESNEISFPSCWVFCFFFFVAFFSSRKFAFSLPPSFFSSFFSMIFPMNFSHS